MDEDVHMYTKEGTKTPEGHSNSLIQNKLTNAIARKEKKQTDK